MKFIIGFTVTLVAALCTLTFLIPFLTDLAEILAGNVGGYFARNNVDYSVGALSAKSDERVDFNIPARFSADPVLVEILVCNGFAKDDVVGFLERNQLPDDIIAGIQSGSEDKIGEFAKMLHEYIFECTRYRLLRLYGF